MRHCTASRHNGKVETGVKASPSSEAGIQMSRLTAGSNACPTGLFLWSTFLRKMWILQVHLMQSLITPDSCEPWYVSRACLGITTQVACCCLNSCIVFDFHISFTFSPSSALYDVLYFIQCNWLCCGNFSKLLHKFYTPMCVYKHIF